MKILVLAAGAGSRFKDYSEIPKPLIKIKGKEIIKRTTDSISRPNTYKDWTFAIQDRHNLDTVLQKLYPGSLNTIFTRLTRGNLETAYECCQYLDDKNEKLLILDSDNAYDGSGLIEKFEKIENGAAICYFEPIDDSAKWCFCFNEEGRVWRVAEKNPEALQYGGKPMVGTFFFSSVGLFEKLAAKVLNNNFKERGEFFMSQAIREALIEQIPVYSFKVKNPIPLGTPEDVEKFLKSDLP